VYNEVVSFWKKTVACVCVCVCVYVCVCVRIRAENMPTRNEIPPQISRRIADLMR